jgi:Protein of unknown function (DUF2637)
MTARADGWIRWTTTGSVAILALIAGTVSYLHMHALVALHGQPGWVAALTPLSVDGMIVAASTTLLADSRSGRQGGVLPWALLTVGSVASLAANVAVAEPTVTGRVIAAWPSFALIGSYELLMRQIRATASASVKAQSVADTAASVPTSSTASPERPRAQSSSRSSTRTAGSRLQHEAWEWALANRTEGGALPSGKAIADRFGRHERWGRLVKRHGLSSDSGGAAQRAA